MLPEHDLFVEAPASFPAEEEEVVEVELRGGRSVPVLSAEDVVVDRLHQFVAGATRTWLSKAWRCSESTSSTTRG